MALYQWLMPGLATNYAHIFNELLLETDQSKAEYLLIPLCNRKSTRGTCVTLVTIL